MKLIIPALAELPQYADALRRGFWSDNLRREQSAKDELAMIDADPAAFIARLNDLEGKAGPIVLPDGTTVPRLPSFRRWMWNDDDGGFCGNVNFRWQRGTSALPEYVLGHVGYAVVPWKQKRGYATKALALLLPECRKQGLAYIELTTDPDNLASQKVIISNGGKLVGRFRAERYDKDELRFRIDL